ncbi:2'-5' RNA ligase family protein [Streptomyces sp. NPDC057539]|uniref:2'-5' RNA ligase family protein n=1 Tax=Streptomyces sp. NPDC057539 TaxID=3346159 RepID=UPI003693D299
MRQVDEAPLTTEERDIPNGNLQEVTHRAGLAPVEARWVHTTVMHGGPVEKYKDGEIDAVTERVRQECASIEPFDLTFDRPAIGRVAVECAARPVREPRPDVLEALPHLQDHLAAQHRSLHSVQPRCPAPQGLRVPGRRHRPRAGPTA